MKLIITSLFVFIGIVFAQAQTINLNHPGFTQKPELNIQQRQSNSYFNAAKRVREFSLNPQISNHQAITVGTQITLSLFDDVTQQATVVRKVTDINGVTTLSLKLDAFNYAYAYIAISSDSYLVTVDLPESHQKYSTQSSINQSQDYMVQLDETPFENASCGLDDDVNANGTGVNSLPNESSGQNRNINLSGSCIDIPDSTDPASITLMMVYTAAAQAWSDTNNGGIANSIAVTLAIANQVSVNNNLGINFTLAYSGLVGYTEQSMGSDWISLLEDEDGFMDEVHDLRRDFGGDLVALLNYYPTGASGATAAGIANLLTSKYGNNRAVFSASRVNFAINSNTFIHEIGHNMGASHNLYQASDPGPSNWENWPENTWSAGWRWQGSDTNYYADLMSYPNGSEYENGQTTFNIPYFSDPNHTHLGGAAGDPILGDNARTLREIKHYVARYKETIGYCLAGTAAISAPTNLYIDNVSMGDINNASGASDVFYGDFTALATCMFPGDTQTLDISVVNSNISRPVKVWIDWNGDKIFDLETELVYDSVTGSANHSISVTAPLGVSYGIKRMRIRTYSNLTEPVVDSPCGYSGRGELEDYTINLEAPEPCVVAEVPQNFQADILTATTAQLSWSSQTGIDHYELRYREIGAPDWDTVSPIWYPYYTINELIFDTEYEAQVRSVCSSTPGSYSPSINFITIGYCAASVNNTSYEKISNVTFNDINNNSTSTAGYEDFTNISSDVEQGMSYTFSASFAGQSYPSDQVLVWIDFNQNGDFSDPGEQVLITPTSISPWQGTIIIANDALLGETRMRVRLHDASLTPNTTPCGNSGYGQVEDYTINVVPPVICEGPTIPINLLVSDLTNDEATLTWDAVPGTTYDVRYREIGAPQWIELNGLTLNTVTLVALIAGTSYEAQVRSVCDSIFGDFTATIGFITLSYCISSGDSNINILNVTFENINQSSPGGSTVSSYTDFTNVSTIVQLGESYSISINAPGPPIAKHFRVWIDFNNNGGFENAEELVLDVQNTMLETVTSDIIIPAEALIGSTRMRVSVKMYSPVQNACDQFNFGEVEDYTVVIEDGTLGLESFSFKDFVMFPNPVNDIFYIGTNNIEQEQVQITVVNMIGQKIYSKYMTVPSGGQIAVDVSGLATGMYLVELLHPQGDKFSAKLIKK